MARCRTMALALLLAGLLAGSLGGCGWFGGGSTSSAEAPTGPQGPGAQARQEQGPFAPGVLNVIAQKAPPGSATQLLARLAAEFGWEPQVAQDPLLKQAVLGGDFEERVEPHLLGLYYKNGWSVLPVVGEGHMFNRDSVVQGAIGSTRLLVTNRKTVRIIFLRPVQNVEIVYYQDGEEPQVFSVSDQSVVAVRQSLAKYYLR
jgi:hypothetical protein